MKLIAIDWMFISGFFAVTLAVGVVVTRLASRSASEFFLSGRTMPWWLLGTSMVATTFSTDTPNLVTDIVRQNGVAGNWVWWAFLLTGMLTVFIYARLWRRTGVMTDVEFYELRYSGKPAAFLRGFRAVYLGVLFNVLIMASVTLAAVKIGGVMLGFSPLKTIFISCLVTVVFCTLGGLYGVLLTDFLLFIVAMIGSVTAAVVALRLPEVGGLAGLFSHPATQGKLSLIPSLGSGGAPAESLFVIVFVLPLAVQWWAAWYPGSEPGGGGYIAQRMLAAKNEQHAVGATLLFNAAHYALRPWPWIIVALASLIVFPELEDLQSAFPHMPAGIIKHDLAYPAMLTHLPPGLLGLVVASLIAAFISTISTHLNWGSSYVVNDVYKRFVKPGCSERELVMVGRVSTVVLMVLAAALALLLRNALEAFHIILQVGAGTGLLFILRWFWARINAFSEISAMVVSFLVALYFKSLHGRIFPDLRLAESWQFVIGVAITTAAWLAVTFLTRPTDEQTLRRFYALARPGGPGWRAVLKQARAEGQSLEEPGAPWNVPLGLLCMSLGCMAVYSALFATGCFLQGQYSPATLLTIAAAVAGFLLMRLWRRVAAG